MVECEVCGSASAKYKCPRCRCQTCSLDCCNKHKDTSTCTGLRNRTEYRPVKEFTDSQLFSDYYFLEEGGRIADSAVRRRMNDRSLRAKFGKRVKRTLVSLPFRPLQSLTKHQKHLRRMVVQRGTEIVFLPSHFKKSKNNTTRIIYTKDGEESESIKTVHWHVEIRYGKESFIEEISEAALSESVPETTTLRDVLCRQLQDLKNAHALRLYRDAPLESLSVFLRIDGTPPVSLSHEPSGEGMADESKTFLPGAYIRVDPQQPLSAILCGARIIEYPVFAVMFSNEAALLRPPAEMPTLETNEDRAPASGTAPNGQGSSVAVSTCATTRPASTFVPVGSAGSVDVSKCIAGPTPGAIGHAIENVGSDEESDIACVQ
eukprot:Rmarinus@m.22382